MKLFFGGPSEPRVEDVLGLSAESAPVSRAMQDLLAPIPADAAKPEPVTDPFLVGRFEVPAWDEWNLTLRNVEFAYRPLISSAPR